MSSDIRERLLHVLNHIDRPGSFCVSGSAGVVLPGLEVDGVGMIGSPLAPSQAEELKGVCEQAPYGKGEETLVDTSVRRVWRLTPDHFALTNPDWEQFLQQMVSKAQEELGLEKQQLQAHLYDLLLYEPGSFFLPHRDGEKLKRMVATLVIVLPSAFEGGELIVRHEGQEKTIDFSTDNPLFRIHYAAFYADCEHEIRPLREGYRLCLVYNLTLAKSKQSITAPRSAEFVEQVSEILRDWAQDEETRLLAVTLEHQYTQEGLTWDALKGVDRVKARVLLEAARQSDCQAHLALLTYHESGSAEPTGAGFGGRRRGRWDDYEEEDEDAEDYEMGEVFDSDLTAEHWINSEGNPLPLGTIDIEEDEVLDPEALEGVDPEVEFEGYTGNAGMTLDHWYRHAAIFLWPDALHFDILCDAGTAGAVGALKLMVEKLERAGKKEAEALRASCVAFAKTIVARWPTNPYARTFPPQEEPSPLLWSLAQLDDPDLIRSYLTGVLLEDAGHDPGKSLLEVCQEHGWAAFQPELGEVFQGTTGEALERNVRLLEPFCLARPRQKKGWNELCAALAQALVGALEGIDRDRADRDFRSSEPKRDEVLAGLARSLLATDQLKLLSRLVAHTLDRPEKYPLRKVHVSALLALQPWLKKNVKKPCPPLAHWIASCCAQLEGLTAEEPEPPADYRRRADISCACADCRELNSFLDDPDEKVHHFRMAEVRRRHLEEKIRQHHCDLSCTTERRGSPHTLVCTKTTASYEAELRTFHQDQQYLAGLRAIQASLPH